MADLTSNFKLEKPLDSEFADVAVLNRNFDKLDEVMARIDGSCLGHVVNRTPGQVFNLYRTNIEVKEITEFKNTFVALSNVADGGVYISGDCIRWSKTYAFDQKYSNAAVYVVGTAIIVRTDSFIATSENGITWKTVQISTLKDFESNCAACSDDGNILVLAGTYSSYYPRVIYSADRGATWTQKAFSSISSSGFLSVLYADGLFVACGGDIVDNGSKGFICRSIDGVTWETVSSDHANKAEKLLYACGKFYCKGQGRYIYVSSDKAQTWSRISLTNASATSGNAFVHLQHLGSRIFCFGDMGITTTLVSDGLTWETASQYACNYMSCSEGSSPPVFMAVGFAVSVNYNVFAYTSTDGVAWARSIFPEHTMNRFLAVTNKGLYMLYKPSGDQWKLGIFHITSKNWEYSVMSGVAFDSVSGIKYFEDGIVLLGKYNGEPVACISGCVGNIGG